MSLKVKGFLEFLGPSVLHLHTESAATSEWVACGKKWDDWSWPPDGYRTKDRTKVTCEACVNAMARETENALKD